MLPSAYRRRLHNGAGSRRSSALRTRNSVPMPSVWVHLRWRTPKTPCSLIKGHRTHRTSRLAPLPHQSALGRGHAARHYRRLHDQLRHQPPPHVSHAVLHDDRHSLSVTSGKVVVQRQTPRHTRETLAVLGPGQETSVQTFARYFKAGWDAAGMHKSLAESYLEARAMKALDSVRAASPR